MGTHNKTWLRGAVVLLVILGFSGCLGTPSANKLPKPSFPTVYAAGSYNDGQKTIPCYWMETRRIDLPGDGLHNAQANCVFVPTWGAVYTAGYFSDGDKHLPCRWLGTARTDLPCSAGERCFPSTFLPKVGLTRQGSVWVVVEPNRSPAIGLEPRELTFQEVVRQELPSRSLFLMGKSMLRGITNSKRGSFRATGWELQEQIYLAVH